LPEKPVAFQQLSSYISLLNQLVLTAMKKNLLIFLLPVFLASTAFSQVVTFTRETMVMTLDASHFTVTGEYCFRNKSSAPAGQTVYFPLPVATSELKMDSIAIWDVTEKGYIMHMRRVPGGVFFQLNIHASDQKILKVTYIMDHNGKEVRYPVMTHIKYWSKPLTEGNYTLQVVDPSLIVDSVSLKPDEVLSENTVLIHKWRKVNFNPDRDLEIWFHKK
jgi:hypothetical protein